MVKIVGTKYYSHDSAIFHLDLDEKKIFAMSTERVTRIKHDNFVVDPLLKEYPFLGDCDYVVHSFEKDNTLQNSAWNNFYKVLYNSKKPKYIKEVVSNLDKINSNLFSKLKFVLSNLADKNLYRMLYYYNLHFFYKNSEKKYFKNSNNKLLEEVSRSFKIDKNKISVVDHHLAHAFSAYYFSPYSEENSLVLTLDGWGDGNFATLWNFNGGDYKLVSSSKTVMSKNDVYNKLISIGTIYSLFTKLAGYTPNSDEGKIEALAAYGKKDKELYDLLMKCYTIDEVKLNFKPNLKVLNKVYSENFLMSYLNRIGDKNFSATIQKWLEDIVVKYLNIVYKKFKISNLILAGGVAANVIMNLNIYDRTKFKNLYVFPAMGDDGTAVGAAFYKAIELGYDLSWVKENYMPYWGNQCLRKDIFSELKKSKWSKLISFKDLGPSWPKEAAKKISNSNVIAVFHGRMEFGPRALGNRSILANPLDPKTRDRINATVKRRPWFQPFCPSVLEEERERLFENSYKHKYMATAFRLKQDYLKTLPCATHIDGTARPQFVEEKDNSNYYMLLKEFKKITGYGIVINTSFNLHGRTIVRTPEDAIRDFIDCNIDYLFIEGYMVSRKK